MVKGTLHVHSTYSDGEFTLEELREIFLSEGCSFVCISDHAEYFNESSIRAYLEHLRGLSDKTFCFVPGLEYRCDQGMHILGYGASQPSTMTDPQAVFRHIETQGAVSVIAHPKDEHFPWIESFEILPQGIETWNSKYDGRYAPRRRTFELLQRLRRRAPGMHAFYGQDLHWKKQFRGLSVFLECETAEPNVILAALTAGNYHAEKDAIQLPSSGILPDALLAEFDRTHSRSSNTRQFLKRGKQALERLGIRVPKALKAQVRRIF
jgi:hypothetical protein